MFYKPSLNHFSGCNHEQIFKRRNWNLCLWILVLKTLAICTWLQLEGSAQRYKVRMNVMHLSQWSYVGAFLYWTNICSLKLCPLLQFLNQFCISSCGQMFRDMRWWSWAGRNVSLLKTVAVILAKMLINIFSITFFFLPKKKSTQHLELRIKPENLGILKHLPYITLLVKWQLGWGFIPERTLASKNWQNIFGILLH